MGAQVGIFCSSNRPELWLNLYSSLTYNDVDFNLCIVGPKPPIFFCPNRLTYIQSNVKPAQCFFIAEHNTVGDYVMNTPDDVMYSPGCLDNLYCMVAEQNNVMSSAKYRCHTPHSAHNTFVFEGTYDSDDPRYRIDIDANIPICTMCSRSVFDNVGIDNNYLAVRWDIDMSFQLQSMGMKLIICRQSTVGDFGAFGVSQQFDDYLYLTDMWFGEDEITHLPYMRKQRKKLIVPLIYNDSVTKVSQGIRHPNWD